MNTTTITGRLTADPEVRFATTGTPVATLRVANNDRDDHPVFVTVTAFATLAQVVGDHLTKGRKVGITGRLHLEEWETDGQKRSKLTVIANQIDFLDAPPTDSYGGADDAEAVGTAESTEHAFEPPWGGLIGRPTAATVNNLVVAGERSGPEVVRRWRRTRPTH